MRRLLAAFLFVAVIGAAGCAQTVEVPAHLHDRLDVDMNMNVQAMTDEELRLHFNDLNNYRTLMQTGRHHSDGLQRLDYEQHVRVVNQRLAQVEEEMMRRWGI